MTWCIIIHNICCLIFQVTETKQLNSGSFTILKEDHTLGNVVRMQLLQDKRVLFAGYKVPHPLLYELVIKVRTDGSETPINCMVDSVECLRNSIQNTTERFKELVEKKKKSVQNSYH